MHAEKIELVEYPSIKDYAESLSNFGVEDYTDIQANEPLNNPYFYLLACSQGDAVHYDKRRQETLNADNLAALKSYEEFLHGKQDNKNSHNKFNLTD